MNAIYVYRRFFRWINRRYVPFTDATLGYWKDVLHYKIANALIRRAMRTPYFHLKQANGEPYMDRYWLVPYKSGDLNGCGPVSFFKRPIAWILQRFDIAIRVHHIRSSDDARAFHDHPWWYCSVILKGGYDEVRPVYDRSGLYQGDVREEFYAGDVIFRRARSNHRLEVDPYFSAWTLFITGKYKNRWGFLVHPEHKVYWRDYQKESSNV